MRPRTGSPVRTPAGSHTCLPMTVCERVSCRAGVCPPTVVLPAGSVAEDVPDGLSGNRLRSGRFERIVAAKCWPKQGVHRRMNGLPTAGSDSASLSRKDDIMQEAENTKVVQDAYAAFSRNDIPTLMTYVADDIVWVGVYGTASHEPTSGERRGKAAVTEFFKQVAEHVHF